MDLSKAAVSLQTSVTNGPSICLRYPRMYSIIRAFVQLGNRRQASHPQ